jgi:mRNA interferase MazF
MPSKAATPKAAPFAFGDVVLVPFPFTSQAAAKQRPAVIVSSRAYAVERPDVVMMAITSQLRPSPAFGEVWLADWQAAGLIKPSAIKPIFMSART